jgi:hypothetical protein
MPIQWERKLLPLQYGILICFVMPSSTRNQFVKILTPPNSYDVIRDWPSIVNADYAKLGVTEIDTGKNIGWKNIYCINCVPFKNSLPKALLKM